VGLPCSAAPSVSYNKHLACGHINSGRVRATPNHCLSHQGELPQHSRGTLPSPSTSVHCIFPLKVAAPCVGLQKGAFTCKCILGRDPSPLPMFITSIFMTSTFSNGEGSLPRWKCQEVTQLLTCSAIPRANVRVLPHLLFIHHAQEDTAEGSRRKNG
jgi:hypothetical protein